MLLRSDRPSQMTLYTDSLGPVSATHFHKYCRNYRKGCIFVHFYGYYKCGTGHLQYNDNWMTLPYFLSSQETGFEMAMLKKFDAELLIGQISYKLTYITFPKDMTQPRRCAKPLRQVRRLAYHQFMGKCMYGNALHVIQQSLIINQTGLFVLVHVSYKSSVEKTV